MKQLTFTREQKRKYYMRKILNLEFALEKAKARLAYIESEEYQDWNSDLKTELQSKKARRKSAG